MKVFEEINFFLFMSDFNQIVYEVLFILLRVTIVRWLSECITIEFMYCNWSHCNLVKRVNRVFPLFITSYTRDDSRRTSTIL